MTFSRYPEYKDSRVEWLGSIPSHWGCEPIKYSTEIYTGNSLNDAEKELYESTSENDIPYISSKDIDLSTHDVNYENGLKIPTESNGFKIAPKDSFLLCVEGGSAGKKITFLEQDVCFVNKLCCFKSKKNSRFNYFFAQSKNFKDKFDLSITGLIGGVSTSALKNFSITIPPDEEKLLIINFLDKEISKIDALVLEQEKLISLLEEKHQSIISKNITEGINPNVKMVILDFEWLKQAPESWAISPIKRFTNLITDGAHISPETDNGVYDFVSTKDLKDGSIDFEGSLKTSVESYEYLVKTGCQPLCNDVLFSKDGTIGRTAIVKTNHPFVVASSLIIIRPDTDKLNSEFLDFLCQSNLVQQQVDRFVKGAGLPRLSIQNFLRVYGAFPELDEQVQIITSIKDQLDPINKLIKEAEKAVLVLQERRSALISGAVTGQIDLRLYKFKEAA